MTPKQLRVLRYGREARAIACAIAQLAMFSRSEGAERLQGEISYARERLNVVQALHRAAFTTEMLNERDFDELSRGARQHYDHDV